MKTVVHVYTNNCNNIKYDVKNAGTYWGLGDLLRGSIKLYQLSEIFNFRLVVDISLHPISEYIVAQEHELTIDANNIKYYYIGSLVNVIKQFLASGDNIIYLNTNDKYIDDFAISHNCRKFMTQLLTPSNELELYIQTQMQNASLDMDYNIMHIRCGDDKMMQYNHSNNSTDSNNSIDKKYIYIKYSKEINIILANIEKSDILITDSDELKYYVDNNCNDVIKTLPLKICHLGRIASRHQVRDTLTEFFIASRCKNIKSYSNYCWISGFIERIHDIYGIPLTILHK